MPTLRVLCLPKEDARLLAKDHWTIRRRHASHAMSQIPLEFMHIIRAFAPAAGVLAVYRIH